MRSPRTTRTRAAQVAQAPRPHRQPKNITRHDRTRRTSHPYPNHLNTLPNRPNHPRPNITRRQVNDPSQESAIVIVIESVIEIEIEIAIEIVTSTEIERSTTRKRNLHRTNITAHRRHHLKSVTATTNLPLHDPPLTNHLLHQKIRRRVAAVATAPQTSPHRPHRRTNDLIRARKDRQVDLVANLLSRS